MYNVDEPAGIFLLIICIFKVEVNLQNNNQINCLKHD